MSEKADLMGPVPTSWRGEDLQGSTDWVVPLDDDDLDELEQAVAMSRHREVRDLRRSDFPLPRFSERLHDVVEELEHGRGFVVLKGLPLYERFSEEDATRAYCGIGVHMGSLVSQTRSGDLIGHIRDLGARGLNDRNYATNQAQPFHTDSTDIVGLLCLRKGLYGGDSLVASSLHMYRLLLEEHPEYLPILTKDLATDWKNEQPPGTPGWYLEPLYSWYGGVLSATVRTQRAVTAMRFPDVPRLSADEMACMLYLESLPKRDGAALRMTLEPGDMQFVQNFVTVHARMSFIDDPEDPTRQRHLLRLWISRPGGRPLCPEYAIWRNGYSR